MRTVKKNILKSLLFVCSGLAIATIAFASVRAVTTVPDPPGRPETVDIQKDGCTLHYLPPRFDGGLRVESFLIECSASSWFWDRWVKKGISKDLYYRINNMAEGSEAIFRVSAANANGLSKPSLSSYIITFTDPYK